MTNALRDLRYAVRALRREAVFASMAIVTFALAIASTTAIFVVVNQVLFRPLPFPDERQVVRIQNEDVSASGDHVHFNMLGAQAEALASETRVFQGVVALEGGSRILLGAGEPQRVSVVAVSPGWMETLGVVPAVGRFFARHEFGGGGDGRPAIISHALWVERFGARQDITSRSLTLEARRYDIVGVFPAGFRFPYSADVWVPCPMRAAQSAAVFGRFAAGVTLEQARLALRSAMPAQRGIVPQLSPRASLALTRARDSFVGNESRVAVSLLGLTAAFLLIGVGNLGNLLLARALARRREAAVRAALGATAWAQFRYACAETLVLTATGASLGLWLAVSISEPLKALVPGNFVRELHRGASGVDGRVYAFTIALALAMGVVTAAVPTWRARRTDPREALGDGARGTSAGTARARLVLATVGLALSFAVLSNAVVLGRHLAALASTPLGLDREGVLTFQVQLPAAAYGAPDRPVRFVDDATVAMSALPGVTQAGFISVNPLAGGTWTVPIVAEGRSEAAGAGSHLSVNHRLVAGDVLEALGVRLLKGRRFTRTDTASSPPVALVSESLARGLWPQGNAVGRRLRVAASGFPWIEVVGVTTDVRDAGEVHVTWYLPYAQHARSAAAQVLYGMVRGAGGRTPPLAPVADALHRLESSAALYEPMPLATVFDETIAQERTGAFIAATLAMVGVFMAALGLYGIVAYLLRQRALEFAIRMALGATHRDVARLLVRHVGTMVAIGVLGGCAGAAALVRIVATQIPDLPASSIATYAVPATILLTACSVAVWSAMRNLSSSGTPAEDLRRN